MPDHPELNLAIQQIEFARQYTHQLFERIEDDAWFHIPSGSVSHLAWQMGHLAMAQYGLTLLRIRGKEPDDADFISNDFLRCFKKGSTPEANPKAYPTVVEIRQVFDAVHLRSLQEMPDYSRELLEESLPMPTAVYENKLGSLLMCPLHEMIHAGHIGAIRRALGKSPLR